MKKEYALYKSEEILAMGTIFEIALEMGVTVETIKYYGCNSYKKKLAKRKKQTARVLVEIGNMPLTEQIDC